MGATKCSAPIVAEWDIAPIMKAYGHIPWSEVRWPLPPWGESFLALECPNDEVILALLRILHTRKTTFLTHLVSWFPASHSRQNDVIAAAPAFRSKDNNYGNAVPA